MVLGLGISIRIGALISRLSAKARRFRIRSVRGDSNNEANLRESKGKEEKKSRERKLVKR